MIELTLGELLEISDFLNKVAATPLPAKQSFLMAKFLKKSDEEIKMARETYAKLKDVSPEETQELLSTIIGFDFEKFPMDLISSLEFSPRKAIILEKIFE